MILVCCLFLHSVFLKKIQGRLKQLAKHNESQNGLKMLSLEFISTGDYMLCQHME